jgi:hypothetical protein
VRRKGVGGGGNKKSNFFFITNIAFLFFFYFNPSSLSLFLNSIIGEALALD